MPANSRTERAQALEEETMCWATLFRGHSCPYMPIDPATRQMGQVALSIFHILSLFFDIILLFWLSALRATYQGVWLHGPWQFRRMTSWQYIEQMRWSRYGSCLSMVTTSEARSFQHLSNEHFLHSKHFKTLLSDRVCPRWKSQNVLCPKSSESVVFGDLLCFCFWLYRVERGHRVAVADLQSALAQRLGGDWGAAVQSPKAPGFEMLRVLANLKACQPTSGDGWRHPLSLKDSTGLELNWRIKKRERRRSQALHQFSISDFWPLELCVGSGFPNSLALLSHFLNRLKKRSHYRSIWKYIEVYRSI